MIRGLASPYGLPYNTGTGEIPKTLSFFKMQLADLQKEIDETRSFVNDADREYQFSLAGGTLHEIREAKNRLGRYRSKMGRLIRQRMRLRKEAWK